MSEDKNKKRQKYSLEFKKEAVELSNKIGPKQAAEQLGVNSSSLANWRSKFSEEDKATSNDKPSYEELERENRRLKREIGYIEEINKVLKKSTAIFSNTHLKNLK